MERPMSSLASASRWLLLLLLISGCATVDRAAAPLDYRLELDPATVPQMARHGGVLRIARPQAEAGTSSRGIAYRTAPHQLRYYTKSRWTDTPARMLGTVLTSAFEASDLFEAVIDDNRLPADYLLTTQLRRLEQVVPPHGAGAVELQFRLQLIQLPQRRLLGSWLIETSAPATADSAAAVAAGNAALSQAVAAAVQSVAAALKNQPQPAEH